MLTICPWPEVQLAKLWSLLTYALLTLPAVFCAVLKLFSRSPSVGAGVGAHAVGGLFEHFMSTPLPCFRKVS